VTMRTRIPVKNYVMDEALSWEERYRQLEAHHLEEVDFLVKRVGQFEAVLDNVKEIRRGCDCDYDYRCSNCSVIVRVQDRIKKLENTP